MCSCVLAVKLQNPSGAVRSDGLNDALYDLTHPSYTTNVRPTATIFSCYVDVVQVGQVVVFLETDVRLFVVVINSQHYLFSLISSYKETDKCQFMTECDAPADSESIIL